MTPATTLVAPVRPARCVRYVGLALCLAAATATEPAARAQPPALDDRRAAVVSYLDTLNAFVIARAALPSGPVQASAAADGNTRKALKALAAAMGASLEPRDRRYTLALSGGPPEEQRRASLRLAGLEVTSVAQEFNTGRPVRLDLRSDTVPLPVPVAVWRGLPGMSGGSVARSILIDQRASWRLATLGRYLDKHRADTEAARWRFD